MVKFCPRSVSKSSSPDCSVVEVFPARLVLDFYKDPEVLSIPDFMHNNKSVSSNRIFKSLPYFVIQKIIIVLIRPSFRVKPVITRVFILEGFESIEEFLSNVFFSGCCVITKIALEF